MSPSPLPVLPLLLPLAVATPALPTTMVCTYMGQVLAQRRRQLRPHITMMTMLLMLILPTTAGSVDASRG
jgi:hypothetical protein